MATQRVNIPEQLFEKVKEAAEREEISVEELVRDALERRVEAKGFASLFAIGDRNIARTGAGPDDVETEIAVHRSDRRR